MKKLSRLFLLACSFLLFSCTTDSGTEEQKTAETDTKTPVTPTNPETPTTPTVLKRMKNWQKILE